jgi:hypothetical protein
MDLNNAILYGQILNAAYSISSDDFVNRAGGTLSAGIGAAKTDFVIVTSIYSNDLASDVNQLRGAVPVYIGLILQSSAGDVVVALRGTEGIFEWVHDSVFLAVPCPFLAAAGNTEDGFTSMYKSLSIGATAGSPSVVSALPSLPWKKPTTSLTICGHSLGGALATLLAVDVAANSATAALKRPVVYTYGSPRTGDFTFANTYSHLIQDTFRIANRMDLIPKLPLPPLYEHVGDLFDLSAIKTEVSGKTSIKIDVACQHFLGSYLHLLSRLRGGEVLPLDPACIPSDAEQPDESGLTETIEAGAVRSPQMSPAKLMSSSRWIALLSFSRFSADARNTLARAQQLSKAYSRKRVQVEHLLLALSEQPQSQLSELLTGRRIDILPILAPELGSSEVPLTSDVPDDLRELPALSVDAGKAVSSAGEKADANGSETIEVSHLLFGVLSISENASVRKLTAQGVTPNSVKFAAAEDVLAGYQSDSPSGTDLLEITKEVHALASVLAAKDVEPPLSLGLFGHWGTGKSFFMHQLERRINELQDDANKASGESAYCRDVVQISFNAWNYIDKDLWASMASEIFEGLAAAIASKRGGDSQAERVLALAAASSSSQIVAETKQQKIEAEERLKIAEQQLADLLRRQTTVSHQPSTREVVRQAARFAIEDEDLWKPAADAAQKIGIYDGAAAAGEIRTQVLELENTWSKISFTVRKNGLWPWVLASLIGFGLSSGVTYALKSYTASEAVARVVSVCTAVSGFLATLVIGSRNVLRFILAMRRSKQELIDRTQQAIKLEVTHAQENVKKEAEAVKSFSQQLENIRSDRRLVDFIRQRYESSDYKNNLGVIARVRADFRHLSILLRDVQAESETDVLAMKKRQKDNDCDRKTPLFPRIDRIILYIDDLDRCPEKNVCEVLQAVHLLLAFPLFVVVVGVDPRWLLHSLRQHAVLFQRDQEGNWKSEGSEENSHWQSTPLNYLEKIFQIPFTLRPIGKTGFSKLVDAFAIPEKKKVADQAALRSTQGSASPPSELVTKAVTAITSPPEQRPLPATETPLQNAPSEETTESLHLPIDRHPEHLLIDGPERSFMKALYEFIPSPRAGKRFINIYRLLRASVKDEERRRFVGDETGGEYQCALVLLAMLTGYPSEATEILEALLKREHSGNWGEFIQSAKDRIHNQNQKVIAVATSKRSEQTAHRKGSESPQSYPLPVVQRWDELFANLATVGGDLAGRSCEGFVAWAPRVARYSFQSGRILLNRRE